MRLIGHLKTESSAKALGDYLVSRDIRNLVEPDAGGWAVWIYSEDQLDLGRQALDDYLANPGDDKFRQAGKIAAAVAERERKEKAQFEKRVRTPDQIWSSSSVAPITLVLMIVSIGVTLVYLLKPESPLLDFLSMSQYLRGLPEIRHGEVWRLVTPIFIHFGVLHILFNMLMFRDIGTAVERRRGPVVFATLVLSIAVISNLGQYLYNGPGFGGMSGVLYGLLGYVWMRGRSDPGSGLYVSPNTLGIMLIWFFLCLFGVIPNVANGCHAVGLVMGMIIGAAPLAKRIF